MANNDRAKQFASFDALKGFREALLEKEKIIVPKTELSEDKKAELDRILHHIKPNDIITVIYYAGNEYLKITGMVSRFSASSRTLQIVGTKLSFDDICDIKTDGI
ncbi:MAG: YolD-like family protein [Lachnospiraceae bacterium]|nr:YolD-like family protein [Lachnospiraceae bacterium]